MTYCVFLEIPTWGAGMTVFVIDQKENEDLILLVVLSLAYMIIPITFFYTFISIIKKVDPANPESESEDSSEEEAGPAEKKKSVRESGESEMNDQVDNLRGSINTG